MVEVGNQAPDFELNDGNEKPVKLSDFKGKKVLIAFFPFAFSGVCTDELSCFKDDLSQFEEKGIQVLGVSVDSHWANKAFGDKLGVSYPLLSDFEKKTAADYGVLRKEGFSERAYFLVDEEGVVKYKHIMENPGTRLENSDLLKAIEA